MEIIYKYKVKGMSCSSCSAKVEKRLGNSGQLGLRNVSVNLATEMVSFEIKNELEENEEITE